MPIVVDVPGIGPTEFESEEQANSFFRSRQEPAEQPKSYLSGLLNKGEAFPPSERARLSFGNPEGVLNYLKQQGVPAEYRDGELYIGEGDKAYPLDPNGFRTLVEAFPPIGAYNSIKDLIQGTSESSNRRRIQDLLDIPSDIAEAGPDALNTLLTTISTAGGPLRMVGGGALGGFAAEKAKEGIGAPLGVYKADGGYVTPESMQATTIGGLSSVPSAALRAGQGISQAVSKLNIPQRLFSSATGMGKELAKNPEGVNLLLSERVSGNANDLTKLSDQQLKQIGDELKGMFAGKEADYEDIVGRIGSFENQFASGNREGARSAMRDVLDEFKSLFKSPDDPQVLGGAAKQGSAGLSDLTFEKSKLARAGRRGYENPDVNISNKASAQKELADTIRPVVEERAPEARSALSRYHAYDALNMGLEKGLESEAKKKIGISEIPSILASKLVGLGGTKAQTKTAGYLYRLLNKGNTLSSSRILPKAQQAALIQLLREGVDLTNNRQQ